MAPGELSNVVVQVLLTELVVGAVIAPPEHPPERYHAVGVGHLLHELLIRVVDRLKIVLQTPDKDLQGASFGL